MAAPSICELPALSGYLELGAQHSGSRKRLASCVRLASADTDTESAWFEDSPSFLVDQGHLPGLDTEGHAAGLSRLEMHAREPCQLTQRHPHRCLHVGEIHLDYLVAAALSVIPHIDGESHLLAGGHCGPLQFQS